MTEEFRGPRYPTGAIMSLAVLIGIAAWLSTAKPSYFILAALVSMIAFSVLYSLVRKRLGWRPLDLEALPNLPFI
ncbi:hypothetical protein [Methylobacterium organophilum]|uniref:Uncharacterized protein n=1 Tax=Methylobacterium organophilum TaxID=410 RepID=A0ABQ4T467_METOR|nr:hypothetical protein [Methylobacterium organophilum]UMY19671.1 hypothetical protein MMB17_10390 [Methylobacterium organophilum]GJE26445.1 hypothetical protein LKMONMHP_1296 [Methylobacterium organophilum]